VRRAHHRLVPAEPLSYQISIGRKPKGAPNTNAKRFLSDVSILGRMSPSVAQYGKNRSRHLSHYGCVARLGERLGNPQFDIIA
jgi:hypothetical protein